MENKESKTLPESYPMIGGDGPCSYSQNSSYQKGLVDAAKELLNEAIANKLDFKNFSFDTSNKFQITDLGCSVGPNTFIAVQNIIEAVEQKYLVEHPKLSLEFQVFFNDHIDNDFNTLFKNLPPSRKYLAAGVPGSFHGRLFPKSTLHFVHCSYALHWLSKVPKEILDSKSPAWNKGSIQCTGYAKEVAKVYSAQFKNDLDSFLNARAQEIVGGGLMVIIASVVPDGALMSQTGLGTLYDFLGSCLIDMAKLGFISEEKVDSFNLPLYYASETELQKLIEGNGYFGIEIVEKLANPMMHKKYTLIAPSMTSLLRSVFEGIIKKHFGNEIIDEIFNYLTKKFEENSSIFDQVSQQQIELFILLKRNMN